MIATITTTEINDPGIASPVKHEILISGHDHPITCYNDRAVMVLVGKFDIQRVRYSGIQDGLIVARLRQAGVTIK